MKECGKTENLILLSLLLIQKVLKMLTLQIKKAMIEQKKVSGIKLHLAVDILGLPLAMYVKTADKTDKIGAREMLSCNFCNLLGIKKILVD